MENLHSTATAVKLEMVMDDDKLRQLWFLNELKVQFLGPPSWPKNTTHRDKPDSYGPPSSLRIKHKGDKKTPTCPENCLIEGQIRRMHMIIGDKWLWQLNGICVHS